MSVASWLRDKMHGSSKRGADKKHCDDAAERRENENAIVETIKAQNQQIQEKSERIEEFMRKVRDGHLSY